MLNKEELERYNRHLILPEIAEVGQERLKNSKVLVVGAGGLGCPILQYLAAAGVGTVGIIDNDKVSISNLQRQILYSSEDINKYKVDVAKQKLEKQNPLINISTYQEQLTSKNALELIKNYDIIVDGTDNFPSRYLVNDTCVILNKPLVFGSIYKFEGQVSVFNYQDGPTYRCLFPEPPKESPNCSEIGVIGVLPGLIGTIQANEVIKIILGIGNVLSGKLLVLDALTMQQNLLNFKLNPKNLEINKLIDYELFCGTKTSENYQLSVQELKEWRNTDKVFEILDVREKREFDYCNLGGIHIPLGKLSNELEKIPKDKKLVVVCHHGNRSITALNLLKDNGFSELYNLVGGLQEWSLKIDKSFPKY